MRGRIWNQWFGRMNCCSKERQEQHLTEKKGLSCKLGHVLLRAALTVRCHKGQLLLFVKKGTVTEKLAPWCSNETTMKLTQTKLNFKKSLMDSYQMIQQFLKKGLLSVGHQPITRIVSIQKLWLQQLLFSILISYLHSLIFFLFSCESSLSQIGKPWVDH